MRPLIPCLFLLAAGCAAPVRLQTRESASAHVPTDERLSVHFKASSPALSRASGRARGVSAEVVLPPDWTPGQQLPVCYHIPDLGEDPVAVAEALAAQAEAGEFPRLALVVLDPRGIHGHHSFVDSVNEGPHGEALIADLIPKIESQLYEGKSAARRFVSGRGMGGWSAIRLQIEYSHAFDAAYAVEPDPLDMRSFYGADLARAKNFYRDSRGEPVRLGGRRLESRCEDELAERIASYESALGPRNDDGRPMPLFQRESGELNKDVVTAFVRQDPAARIRERGASLAPRLVGKIHAIARRDDSFGRDTSLREFQQELMVAGIDSTVRTPQDFDPEASLMASWATMAGSAQP